MREFIKKEPVLFIAGFLAIITSFINVPDMGVFDAIDYRVLVILFCLMTITKGLEKEGVLEKMALWLLGKVKDSRSLNIVLVMLCFFSAMIVTNDVALITFVPFAIKILPMAGQRKSIIKVIVLQTIAANMGSILIPIGNPQNLYLYSLSGISAARFAFDMSVMWICSLIIILAIIFIEKNSKTEKLVYDDNIVLNKTKAGIYAALFLFTVLSVMHIINFVTAFIVVVIVIAITDRNLFFKTDYCLLATFVCFFIFIYNIKTFHFVNSFFEANIAGKELICGFVLSQVISNVPAAILLSGFTENVIDLAAGVNLGGLGTLIASMASLISYKLYGQGKNADIKRFMVVFTKYNLIFIVLLLPAAIITYFIV